MPGRSAANRGDVTIAVALASGFFALYAATLCRTVYWYDSAELVTAAATLGIAHPPGYPVYTWIGALFTRLPLEPAVAVNAMSAVCAATASALVFVMVKRLGAGRGPSAVAAGLLGAGVLFWKNAVVAEVYCPAVASAALTTYLLLRGLQERRTAITILGALVAGLSVGIHMSIATLGLGFVWLVWMNGKRVTTLLASGGAALVGAASVFAWISLRASQDPPLNVCDPSNLEQLGWYVSGGAYRAWFREGPGAVERALRIVGSFADQVTWVGLALAALGFVWLARSKRNVCLAFALMALGNVAWFFRYQAHDVEVFFLHTTMILCFWAGCGVRAVSAAISASGPDARRVGLGVTAVAALIPLSLLASNYTAADMSGFHETEPYLEAVGETLARDSVILSFTTPDEWKRFAVFGMYGQLVRDLRPDVRHWHSPDIRRLARDFDSSPTLYAYAPTELLTRFFEVVPDGPLYRVTAPKPDAALKAPRKRRSGRFCGTYTRFEVQDAP